MFIEKAENPDDTTLTVRIMSSDAGMMVLERELLDEGRARSDFFFIHDAVMGPYLGDGMRALNVSATIVKMKQYQPASTPCVEVVLEDGRSLTVVIEQQITRVLSVILSHKTVHSVAIFHDPRFKPEKRLYN